MYTLKISDENTVVTTVKEKIIERSNYVDKIQIIVDKLYREQIDMTDATVWMKYKMPVTDKIKMTQLVINDAAYETDYIQYLIPADAYLTAEAGDIEVSFTFVKLVQNDDESTTSYVRKTTSGIIHISPLASFDKYEPSEMLDEIDQRLLEMIALQKNMKELNESIYNGMVKDVRLDTENKKITLVNKEDEDTGNGIVVKDLSTLIAEDLTGKDPDGVQDGVVHVDQVPNIQMADLDLLLK